MSTISNERLEELANGDMEVWYSESQSMARELLALRKERERAEPDYYVVVTSAGVWQSFHRNRAEAEFIVSKPFNPGYSVLEIYTAPPAPVVPDEHHSVIAEQLAHILSVMDVTDHQRAVINCAVDRLNKNAEMLQQPSTTPSSREAILYEPSPTDSANAPLEFTDVEDRAWVVGAEWMRDAFKGENPHLRIANDEDAAPAPVSVPAITFNSASAFEDFWSNFEHPFAEDDELKSFASEIYRAAMLKQPVSTAYKLPDGWVAVPVEPTQEMIDAHVEGVQSGGMQKGYRAMLAAAPAPGKEG